MTSEIKIEKVDNGYVVNFYDYGAKKYIFREIHAVVEILMREFGLLEIGQVVDEIKLK